MQKICIDVAPSHTIYLLTTVRQYRRWIWITL
jgi:hypothetical protein